MRTGQKAGPRVSKQETNKEWSMIKTTVSAERGLHGGTAWRSQGCRPMWSEKQEKLGNAGSERASVERLTWLICHAWRHMGSLGVPQDGVEVDGLVRLVDVALEKAGKELDLCSICTVACDTLAFLLLPRLTVIERQVNELELIDRLLHFC